MANKKPKSGKGKGPKSGGKKAPNASNGQVRPPRQVLAPPTAKPCRPRTPSARARARAP
jgi:hypothetical protein